MTKSFQKSTVFRNLFEGVILAIVISVANVSFAQSREWVKVESGTLAWLKAIHFVDEKTGWIGGSAGTLLKTSDGGGSWQRHKSPTRDQIRDLYFFGKETGWMLCERSIFGKSGFPPTYILKTEDSGESWKIIDIEAGRERMLRFVAGSDRKLKYVIGEMGTMLSKSPDREFFTRSTLATKAILSDGHMFGPDRGVIVGGAGTILSTDDGGITWRDAVYPNEEDSGKFNSVHFADNRSGWIAGNDGIILHTSNAGKSWKRQVSGTTNNLQDIHFMDAENGIAVGENGTILTTVDGGQTWTKELRTPTHNLERISFLGTRRFVTGFGGALLSKELSKGFRL